MAEAGGTELAKSLRMGACDGGGTLRKRSPGTPGEESFWETMEGRGGDSSGSEHAGIHRPESTFIGSAVGPHWVKGAWCGACMERWLWLLQEHRFAREWERVKRRQASQEVTGRERIRCRGPTASVSERQGQVRREPKWTELGNCRRSTGWV